MKRGEAEIYTVNSRESTNTSHFGSRADVEMRHRDYKVVLKSDGCVCRAGTYLSIALCQNKAMLLFLRANISTKWHATKA